MTGDSTVNSKYSGHLNNKLAQQYLPPHTSDLAPNFPDETTTFPVPHGNYIVMGDNTMNSLDSRAWGEFPATSIIGKSFFVYWPITARFGWGQQ